MAAIQELSSGMATASIPDNEQLTGLPQPDPVREVFVPGEIEVGLFSQAPSQINSAPIYGTPEEERERERQITQVLIDFPNSSREWAEDYVDRAKPAMRQAEVGGSKVPPTNSYRVAEETPDDGDRAIVRDMIKNLLDERFRLLGKSMIARGRKKRELETDIADTTEQLDNTYVYYLQLEGRTPEYIEKFLAELQKARTIGEDLERNIGKALYLLNKAEGGNLGWGGEDELNKAIRAVQAGLSGNEPVSEEDEPVETGYTPEQEARIKQLNTWLANGTVSEGGYWKLRRRERLMKEYEEED